MSFPAPAVFFSGLIEHGPLPSENDWNVYGAAARGGPDWTLDLGFVPAQQDALLSLGLTFPRPPDKQVSFNFPLRSSIPWLQLRPGEAQTSPTADDAFSVTVTRTEPTSWRFDFTRTAGPGPYPGQVTSGHLVIKGDAQNPPWRQFTLTADLLTDPPDHEFSESFSLSFCRQRGVPCPTG
jgi:hypothetical protein